MNLQSVMAIIDGAVLTGRSAIVDDSVWAEIDPDIRDTAKQLAYMRIKLREIENLPEAIEIQDAEGIKGTMTRPDTAELRGAVSVLKDFISR